MAGKMLNQTARVAKNTLATLASVGLNRLFNYFLIIYIARIWGAEAFGEYALILSTLAIFEVLADFGLETVMTKEISRNSASLPRYFGNMVCLRLIFSLLAFGSMIVFLFLLGSSGDLIGLAAVVGFSVFFTSNAKHSISIMTAYQRMELPALASFLTNTGRVVFSMIAIWKGAGIIWLLGIQTMTAMLYAGLVYCFLKTITQPRFEVHTRSWKALLQQALPLALVQWFAIMHSRIDVVMLATLRNQATVGFYNAAYRLMEIFYLWASLYSGVLFPVIAAYFGVQHEKLKFVYEKSLKYFIVILLPTALGCIAFAPDIIRIIYGEKYTASVPVLQILMCILPFLSFNYVHSRYLIAMGRQKTLIIILALGTAANICLNAVFIPYYGALGAAAVTCISEFLLFILYLATLRKAALFDWPALARNFLLPAGAGLGMGGIWYGWHDGNSILRLIAGGLVYILILFLFGVFDRQDREIIRNLLHPTR
ncbi:flippase [candidate division FCPU426 bacterium]|nr:flippase [candidate division FCPU426 bacterium]